MTRAKGRGSNAALRSRLREAVERGLKGDWQGAHAIVQNFEGDAIADWIHGVAHRMEGDLGNAAYWYRRCRRKLREDVTTEAELREIAAALED
jgi:hypothetical protein